MKKIFMLFVIVVFTCTFLGCSNNKVKMANYKTEAIISLQTYAEGKFEERYSKDNWDEICSAVVDGKKVIESAKGKSDVDKAVTAAKKVIDQVDWEIDEGGIELSDELRLEILGLYQSWVFPEFGKVYSYKGHEVFKYYGQYNGFYVIKFSGWYFSYSPEIIDGLNFSRPGAGEIFAIKDDFGGKLIKIYEEGYLSRDDLEEIHRIHDAIFAPYRYLLNHD